MIYVDRATGEVKASMLRWKGYGARLPDVDGRLAPCPAGLYTSPGIPPRHPAIRGRLASDARGPRGRRGFDNWLSHYFRGVLGTSRQRRFELLQMVPISKAREHRRSMPRIWKP